MVLHNEIHYNYERYFPISEYIEELKTLLASILPDPSWIPLALRRTCYRSLAQFWHQLPQYLAGRVTWERHELLPLACALASPSKNGCHPGRYPEQMTYLREWVEANQRTSIEILDYGCSTGLVTYEIVEVLEPFLRAGRIVAVTREPLEAWMASRRYLPHLNAAKNTDIHPYRKYSFPAKPQRMDLCFVASNIQQFTIQHPVDVIICNGLIGGEHMNEPREFYRLWEKFKHQLKIGGILVVGSRFHDGFKKNERQFVELRPDCMTLTCHAHSMHVFTYVGQ